MILGWSPSKILSGIAGHIFGREPSNDYFIKILFLLSKWFQARRFLWEFPIRSYVKLTSAVVAILVGVLKCWTQVCLEGRVSFKFVSVSAVLYPRWPLLLKIEISSNGQNCSILSQNVPKFELYKHNDELFSIYYRIFYELISSPFFLFWAWRPLWLEVGITGHNFGRGPSKNHFSKVWLRLAQ
jgi:hypothetical protein